MSRRAPSTYQPACKPGSVGRRANPPRDGHSSGTPLARRLQQPTRTTGPGHRVPGQLAPRAVPIRSCSRWGLPCRFRCRKRGALLPHRFTLAVSLAGGRRFTFCGTFPGIRRACARFLPPDVIRHRMSMEPGLSSQGRLSALPQAAVRPTDATDVGAFRSEINDVRATSLTDRAASPWSMGRRAHPRARGGSGAGMR